MGMRRKEEVQTAAAEEEKTPKPKSMLMIHSKGIPHSEDRPTPELRYGEEKPLG